MTDTRIIIVGGGLSGLYAAYLLEQQGLHDYLLLEARPELGGRVLSAPVPGHELARVDLGATWFWPSMQPEFGALVDSLGLRAFAQPTAGQAVFERSAHQPPQRFPGYPASPTSMRLEGGIGTLVDALRERIDGKRLVTGHAVDAIHATDRGLRVDARWADGQAISLTGRHVLLAMPPRLAAASVRFDPVLPPSLAAQWADTATWMAPHAKYVAVYPAPFWRGAGLSGDAFSHASPMGEIHDAGPVGGPGALFGFLGLPAQARQSIAAERLRALCRSQLVRLFGQQAATPVQEWLQDWSREPWTAVPADMAVTAGHGSAPLAHVDAGPWAGRLVGIASEWSPEFPGYLAGAIDAARRGVQRTMSTP